MTASEASIAADEAARLVECAQEPIHIPGAIQPHGALLAVDQSSLTIVQVSANVASMLGHEPTNLLGASLSVVVGTGARDQIGAALAGVPDLANPIPVHVGTRAFDAVVHRSSDGFGIVELEPCDASVDDRSLTSLHASMQRLSRMGTVEELRAEAAREVRRLTGFDRVMVYHFHPDGHGEVVAEDRDPEMEPYLGLHYPASDIPAQARRLYVLRGSRMIPANEYEPVPLVPSDSPRTGGPLDLSLSELRDVSPHHLTFMRNMGVAASLSISLVHGGELIGMISCGHREPRHVSYNLRRGCEILAQQVTLQTRALSETRRLERRLRLQAVRTRLVDQMAGREDPAAALVQGELSVVDLLAADGAVVRIDGRVAAVGDTPEASQVAALMDVLRHDAGGAPLVTEALVRDRPDLAAVVPAVGVVAMPLGDDGDYLAWFRHAIAQDVSWLGDQSADNRLTPLSPRSSFSSWRQTVTDRALPWDPVEVQEGVELRDIIVRHTAQELARRASARAALTARVSAALAETLDAEEAVARLAQLVVPALADWCIVTLVDDDEQAGARRSLRDVSCWHARPEDRPLVERYAQLRMTSLASTSFLARAFDGGQVVNRESGATAAIREMLRPGEVRDVLERLAPESVTVLPLRGRNSTVGLISLFNGAARAPISRQDLATAEEVAGRAGLALDNSRLYRQQRQLAEGLQRSLLTDPPQPDHLEIVVRYVPAAEAARVGGDWYDAFLQPSGSTVLVIGDVVGHDITAAAAMGQLRSLMRGIAVATGTGPAELLAQVDRAMRALRAETIATAVVARLEQSAEERDQGVTRVRWSNAGHPEPMVITPEGAVSPLSGTGSDLVLGVVPQTPRHESTLTLRRGATLFFHTDGLVERRDRSLQDGITRLEDVLTSVASRPLPELCDAVLSRMLPSRPEDDVAVVAVRLHPQDAPPPDRTDGNRPSSGPVLPA